MRALLAVGFLAGVVAPAFAQGERVITTTGTATVYAKPDVARIHYGVRVSEPAADAAKDVLTKQTAAIDEAIKKLKLGDVQITTAPIIIRQSSGQEAALMAPAAGAAQPGPGLGPFIAYSSHTATITNSDPEKLRAAVDAFVKAATEAGANTGGGEERTNTLGAFLPGQESGGGPTVVLVRSDDSAARQQALKAAVEKAVKSARTIAEALGAKEVKVVSVAEAPEAAKQSPESIFGIYGIDAPPSGPRAPAGEVEVKVRVTVKCSY